MAIEAQRYANKEKSPFVESEEYIILELPEMDSEAGGGEFQVGENGEMLPVQESPEQQ